MAKEPRIVHVAPGSELAHLLEEAENTSLILEKNGELYRVDRQVEETEDIFAHYDSKRAQEALKRSVGALAYVDREELLADLREQREQDSHGRPA